MLLRKRVLVAVGIGTTAAFTLVGLAAVVDELGYESAAPILVWPNALLQSLVPPHNIGTPEHPVLEVGSSSRVSSRPQSSRTTGTPQYTSWAICA